MNCCHQRYGLLIYLHCFTILLLKTWNFMLYSLMHNVYNNVTKKENILLWVESIIQLVKW